MMAVAQKSSTKRILKTDDNLWGGNMTQSNEKTLQCCWDSLCFLVLSSRCLNSFSCTPGCISALCKSTTVVYSDNVIYPASLPGCCVSLLGPAWFSVSISSHGASRPSLDSQATTVLEHLSPENGRNRVGSLMGWCPIFSCSW